MVFSIADGTRRMNYYHRTFQAAVTETSWWPTIMGALEGSMQQQVGLTHETAFYWLKGALLIGQGLSIY